MKSKLSKVEENYHNLLTHNNPKQKIHHHLKVSLTHRGLLVVGTSRIVASWDSRSLLISFSQLKQENADMKKTISDLQKENALLLARKDHIRSNSDQSTPANQRSSSISNQLHRTVPALPHHIRALDSTPTNSQRLVASFRSRSSGRFPSTKEIKDCSSRRVDSGSRVPQKGDKDLTRSVH